MFSSPQAESHPSSVAGLCQLAWVQSGISLKDLLIGGFCVVLFLVSGGDVVFPLFSFLFGREVGPGESIRFDSIGRVYRVFFVAVTWERAGFAKLLIFFSMDTHNCKRQG